MFLSCYESGNLYKILDASNGVPCWRDIVEILWSISNGLNHIHREKLIHGNLHGGNVLVDNENDFIYTCISDVGLNIFAGKEDEEEPSEKENKIYSVLPYIAPEVLSGEKFTYESDIYSFGILMWTLSAGVRPFSNVPHDKELAQRILNGERPSVTENSPKSYNDLMQRCWDNDPSKRPKAKELLNHPWITTPNKKSLKRFINENDSSIPTAIFNELKNNYKDNLSSMTSSQNEKVEKNNSNADIYINMKE